MASSRFDGFFTGELDAVETFLKTKYDTDHVFQGMKVIGSFPYPGISITMPDGKRDPRSKFGYDSIIRVIYVQHTGRKLPPQVWDEAETLMDYLVDHWAARNVSDNGVTGVVGDFKTTAIRDKKKGFLNWVFITNNVYKLTDEG